jgi:hypothetical protein
MKMEWTLPACMECCFYDVSTQPVNGNWLTWLKIASQNMLEGGSCVAHLSLQTWSTLLTNDFDNDDGVNNVKMAIMSTHTEFPPKKFSFTCSSRV